MQDQSTDIEQIHFPYIIFTIKGGLYCVNSKYIATILQLPNYEPIPDAPPHVTGMFPYRDGIVEMFDVRSALSIPRIDEEFAEFCDMLDARKEDHIHWVAALEESLNTGEPFVLATDAHECAFGKWFYNQKFENNVLTYQLQKIEEPHERIHHTAIDLENHIKENGGVLDPEYRDSVLDTVKNQLMPKMLNLLDETKVVFRSSFYHGMILLLNNGSGVGLVVDDVLSVENLSPSDNSQPLHAFNTSYYVTSIQKSEKTAGLILELNIVDMMKDCGFTI